MVTARCLQRLRYLALLGWDRGVARSIRRVNTPLRDFDAERQQRDDPRARRSFASPCGTPADRWRQPDFIRVDALVAARVKIPSRSRSGARHAADQRCLVCAAERPASLRSHLAGPSVFTLRSGRPGTGLRSRPASSREVERIAVSNPAADEQHRHVELSARRQFLLRLLSGCAGTAAVQLIWRRSTPFCFELVGRGN